jgi:hypothetical protein
MVKHRSEAFQNLVKPGELPIDSTNIKFQYAQEEERESVINANTNLKINHQMILCEIILLRLMRIQKLENRGNHSLKCDERSGEQQFDIAILKKDKIVL